MLINIFYSLFLIKLCLFIYTYIFFLYLFSSIRLLVYSFIFHTKKAKTENKDKLTAVIVCPHCGGNHRGSVCPKSSCIVFMLLLLGLSLGFEHFYLYMRVHYIFSFFCESKLINYFFYTKWFVTLFHTQLERNTKHRQNVSTNRCSVLNVLFICISSSSYYYHLFSRIYLQSCLVLPKLTLLIKKCL